MEAVQVSVTVIKDLAKAVREQEEHRKALRERDAKAGRTVDTSPPAPEPGPAPDSSSNDS
jgi:nicotinamidase-related amidase